MKRIVIGLVCFLSFHSIFSQKDCVQVLAEAENEFNAGHFYGLSSLLKECLESNEFSNEQKLRAYKLLVQSYLLTDDPIAAEDSYLKLLKANPEYVSDERTDPVDVFYLSKKFTTVPTFTPTLFRFGPNFSIARIIERVNTNALPAIKYKEAVKAGFQIGSGVDWNMNDHLAIGGEFNLSFKSFKSSARGIFENELSRGIPDEAIAIEKQYWLDIPLFLKYGYNKGIVRPFAYIGVAINFLLSDKVQLEYINRSPGLDERSSAVENRTQGPNVNLMYKRNFLNHSLVIGAGFKYKFSKDFLVFDVRYMAGLSNVTNINNNFYQGTNDYRLSETVAKYSFIGDYFRIDNFSLSIGYVKPLYNPRKIKKVKTRLVSRKITNRKTKK